MPRLPYWCEPGNLRKIARTWLKQRGMMVILVSDNAAAEERSSHAEIRVRLPTDSRDMPACVNGIVGRFNQHRAKQKGTLHAAVKVDEHTKNGGQRTTGTYFEIAAKDTTKRSPAHW